MKLTDLEGLSELDATAPVPIDRPFTAAQAAVEGVTRRQLGWLVDRGFLRRPLRGVYAATQLGDSTQLRCESLRLVVPEDCVVVDRHAGWLLGAQMILAPNEHIELRPISIFRPSGHGRLRNELSLSGERNLRRNDIQEIGGIQVTTPLRTACDLGRVRWTEPAISALDSMLALKLFTRDELVDEVERFRRMRFVTTLRAIAPLADGRAQSPGESVLRLRWIEARLPTCTPQLMVNTLGGSVYYLDLAREDAMFAAEYDGVEWHSSDSQIAHDQERRDELTDLGWLMQPFLSDDVFGRHQRAEQMLQQGMAHARSRRGSLVISARPPGAA